MAIKFRCTCGKEIEALNALSGKKYTCGACGAALTVPQVAPPPASAPIALPPRQDNEGESSGKRKWLLPAAAGSGLVLAAFLTFLILAASSRGKGPTPTSKAPDKTSYKGLLDFAYQSIRGKKLRFSCTATGPGIESSSWYYLNAPNQFRVETLRRLVGFSGEVEQEWVICNGSSVVEINWTKQTYWRRPLGRDSLLTLVGSNSLARLYFFGPDNCFNLGGAGGASLSDVQIRQENADSVMRWSWRDGEYEQVVVIDGVGLLKREEFTFSPSGANLTGTTVVEYGDITFDPTWPPDHFEFTPPSDFKESDPAKANDPRNLLRRK